MLKNRILFGITLTAVGQHLQILEESELVRTEKVGRWQFCGSVAASRVAPTRPMAATVRRDS